MRGGLTSFYYSMVWVEFDRNDILVKGIRRLNTGV